MTNESEAVATESPEIPVAATPEVEMPEPVAETPEAPAPEAAPDPTPAAVAPAAPEPYGGEEYHITSNSGRTVVTVKFEADEMGADAFGNPVVIRTGEGLVNATRDGQNVLAYVFMREQPLS